MLITDATNLPRLMNCNGSRLMAAVLPPDGNQLARDEGNAAHWVAQQAFNGVSLDQLTNTKAFNGFTITDEMVEHVASYISALDCGEMEISTSHGTEAWLINGRADHIVYSRGIPDELTVDDFKFGWRIVEPENNWTLISHAIGYCIEHQIQPAVIVLRIHQPQPHHPDGKLREWRISYAQLMEFYGQIDRTLTNPSDMLVTGIEWCAKCHALPTCPAARLARCNAIDTTSEAFNDNLADDVLSHELDVLRIAYATIKSQRDALEELVTYRIKNGAVVPNYGLETQYAHTRWKTGISADALTLTTGRECRKVAAAITPAEAKRRGVPETLIKSLTERPMTGTKLIRQSANSRAQKLLQQGN